LFNSWIIKQSGHENIFGISDRIPKPPDYNPTFMRKELLSDHDA